MDGNGQGGPNRQRYGPRMTSDSAITKLNGAYGAYPQHNHHQSHDTVNTGGTNGSDSTGPWANSTDPSSESSSPDRYHAGAKQHQMVDTYGYDSYGGGPIMEERASEDGNPHPQRMSRGPNAFPTNGGPPPVPLHTGPRVPIKLGGGDGSAFATQAGSLPTTARPKEEKRKSWLKRRFSKNE